MNQSKSLTMFPPPNSSHLHSSLASSSVQQFASYKNCKNTADQAGCEKKLTDIVAKPACILDLKRWMCLGGARPCKAVGTDISKDTRGTAPCEWCTKIISAKSANGCSSPGAPFNFWGMYSKFVDTVFFFTVHEVVQVLTHSQLRCCFSSYISQAMMATQSVMKSKMYSNMKYVFLTIVSFKKLNKY